MFYDVYLKLCEDSGISPSNLAVQLNISKGTFSNWKTGGEPLNPTKKKIADYFNISVAELMSGEIKEKPITYIGDRLTDDEREMLELMRRVPQDKRQQAEDYLIFLAGNQ